MKELGSRPSATSVHPVVADYGVTDIHIGQVRQLVNCNLDFFLHTSTEEEGVVCLITVNTHAY